MMGLRGCRLGIVHPEITDMQATAILEAATRVAAAGGHVHPHIMVPLVATTDEMDHQLHVIHAAAKRVAAATGEKGESSGLGVWVWVGRGGAPGGGGVGGGVGVGVGGGGGGGGGGAGWDGMGGWVDRWWLG